MTVDPEALKLNIIVTAEERFWRRVVQICEQHRFFSDPKGEYERGYDKAIDDLLAHVPNEYREN